MALRGKAGGTGPPAPVRRDPRMTEIDPLRFVLGCLFGRATTPGRRRLRTLIRRP